jgi:prevent-host-death family protein
MDMSHYSVAEARNNLPKLLDRMLEGEEVVITRRGKPIAHLHPVRSSKPRPPVDLAWLRSVRITPTTPVDGPTLVREMRDGYRY